MKGTRQTRAPRERGRLPGSKVSRRDGNTRGAWSKSFGVCLPFFPLLATLLLALLAEPAAATASLRLRPTAASRNGGLHEDKPSHLRQKTNDDEDVDEEVTSFVVVDREVISRTIADYVAMTKNSGEVGDGQRRILAQTMAKYLMLQLETSKPLKFHLRDLEATAAAAHGDSADRRLSYTAEEDEGQELAFVQSVFDGHDDLIQDIHDAFGVGQGEDGFDDETGGSIKDYFPIEVSYGIAGQDNIKLWIHEVSRELEYDVVTHEHESTTTIRFPDEGERRHLAENIADFLVDVAPQANGPVAAYLMDLEDAAWGDEETHRPDDVLVPFIRSLFSEYPDLTDRIDLAFKTRSDRSDDDLDKSEDTHGRENRRLNYSATMTMLDEGVTSLLRQYFVGADDSMTQDPAQSPRRHLQADDASAFRNDHDRRRREVAESISDWLVSIAPNAKMSLEGYILHMDLAVDEAINLDNSTTHTQRRLRTSGDPSTAAPFMRDIFSGHEDLIHRAESSFRRRAQEINRGYHDAIIDSDRFEQIGVADTGEPQYRFIQTNETKAKEMRGLDEAHAAFNDMRAGMDKFQTIQVEAKKNIHTLRTRRLQTPRSGFDESFTMFEDETFLHAAGIHRRRLSATASDCVQDDDLCTSSVGALDDVNSGINSVLTHLSLVGQILELPGEIHTMLGLLHPVASVLENLFKLAGNIPYIGFIFKGAGYMMKAIKTVLKNLKDKSKQIKVHVVPKFSRPVNLATDALSKVQEQVGDYSTLVVGLTTLRAPQCMEDLIAGLASFNPYTVMEQIQNYIEEAHASVINPIEDFLMNNQIWNGFLGTFEAVMNSPVFQFLQDTLFAPFEPLADILAFEINIPWFALPYSTEKLGHPACRRNTNDVAYTKQSGGYCLPGSSGADLCRGSSKSRALSATCTGADSTGYYEPPSGLFSSGLNSAKDRCSEDPECTGLTWKPGSGKAKLKTGALDSGVKSNSLYECYVKRSPHLTELVDYPSAMKNNYRKKCKETCPSGWEEDIWGTNCIQLCSGVGLSQHAVFDSCNNKKINRGHKTYRLGCPSGYKNVIGEGCMKECVHYSGYTKYQTPRYCWKNDCPSGFEVNPWYPGYEKGMLCERTSSTKYSIRDHETVCDKFKASHSRVERRGDAGGYYNCHTMCEIGDWQDPIFQACWPPARLIVSVQDIVDAFASILSFLTGAIEKVIKLGIEAIILPLLGGISDGLDAFLSILTFDLDAILQVLDDLFGIEFPFLSDVAEMLDFENPIEPWLDGLRDFAGDFVELIDDALAMPQSIINAIDTLADKFKIGNIVACNGSSSPEDLFECMYSKLGIGPPPDLFGALNLELLEKLMFDDSFADALYDILFSIEGCDHYDDVNIPYDKLLEDAGIILPEPRCEIAIPVCKSFSFGSDFSAAVNRFAGLFGEVLTARRRRLSLLEQPFSFAIPINDLIPALDQLLTGVILGKMKFSKIAFSKNKFMIHLMDFTVKPLFELGFTLYPPIGGSDFHFDITLGVKVQFEMKLPSTPRSILKSVMKRTNIRGVDFDNNIMSNVANACYKRASPCPLDPFILKWDEIHFLQVPSGNGINLGQKCWEFVTMLEDIADHKSRTVNGKACGKNSIEAKIPTLPAYAVLDQDTNEYVYICGEYWAEKYNDLEKKAKDIKEDYIKTRGSNNQSWNFLNVDFHGILNDPSTLKQDVMKALIGGMTTGVASVFLSVGEGRKIANFEGSNVATARFDPFGAFGWSEFDVSYDTYNIGLRQSFNFCGDGQFSLGVDFSLRGDELISTYFSPQADIVPLFKSIDLNASAADEYGCAPTPSCSFSNPGLSFGDTSITFTFVFAAKIHSGSEAPTTVPSDMPSETPSVIPSSLPSVIPSTQPSNQPSLEPSTSSWPTEESYDFENKADLINAVDLWRTDQYDAKRIYLRPHSWNVSIIEDFDSLFDVERDEGWRHYNFTELDMAPWDTSSLTSAYAMFRGTRFMDSNLEYWDVTKLQNTKEMFAGSLRFDRTLCWNGQSSTYDSYDEDSMADMFFDTTCNPFDLADTSPFIELFERRNDLSPYHLAVDGCSSSGDSHHATSVGPETSPQSLAVNCCRDDGSSVQCKRTDPQCFETNKYRDAVAQCELLGVGWRLCSANELDSGACCGEGCGFDNSLSWTSTDVYSGTAIVYVEESCTTFATSTTDLLSCQFKWVDNDTNGEINEHSEAQLITSIVEGPCSPAGPIESSNGKAVATYAISPTNNPTRAPTKPPTKHPTRPPTRAPTKPPTEAPTKAPTKAPTRLPTRAPTRPPTRAPTRPPTSAPIALKKCGGSTCSSNSQCASGKCVLGGGSCGILKRCCKPYSGPCSGRRLVEGRDSRHVVRDDLHGSRTRFVQSDKQSEFYGSDMQGIPTPSTGQDQQYVSRELQSTSTSYCAMAAVFDLESLRPQKSLKIDVEVSVAYDADGSIASHSNAEVGTSAYHEGATAKVYKEVGTGYCGDSDGQLFPSINFMGVATLEDCLLKCRSLDNTNTQVGFKRTPSASGRHCDCLYTATDYLPADTKGGTRHENPGTGHAVTLANSNADWRCYRFQPPEGDGCDMGCLEERCLNQSTDWCGGYLWDSVAQRGTLVMNGHIKPSVMDSSLEYYQRPVYDRLGGSCQSTTRLCEAYADGILCTSSNWNVATCIAMSDTLPDTCSGTLDSSGAPINEWYYDFTLDYADSSHNERLIKAIEMCDKEVLCVGFNWNHGTGSSRHRASFRYQISSTVSNSNNKCYLKPPVRYTYDKNSGQCSGEELCAGESSSSIPICDSTDESGWTKFGCDNVCLEKKCYREPLCAGYTQEGNRGKFMKTITGATTNSFRNCYSKPSGIIEGLGAGFGSCMECPPSSRPSSLPSNSIFPSITISPTTGPSQSPSSLPSESPSLSPTFIPSEFPSLQPSKSPSEQPSYNPTSSVLPSFSGMPSSQPSESPSISKEPSSMPSTSPSETPSISTSPSNSLAPSAPYVMTDETVVEAVRSWLDDEVNATFSFGHISRWDVSAVTKFDRLFQDTHFNDDISSWDTGSATSMIGMFKNTSDFDQNITGWDVSSMVDFSEAFESSVRFNQDLKDWDVTANGINFKQTFKNASLFDQMLCWTWHEHVYLLETFMGTACDLAGLDCNACQPSSKPSMMPSISTFPSLSLEPSLLPSQEPSDVPTNYPTMRPTDFFTEECLAIVNRTPGTSHSFTMDYVLEIDLCEDPSLNSTETDALQGVVFDFLNAGASEACQDNLNFMLVSLEDFSAGGSCTEGSGSNDLSVLTFSVEGLGKNCMPFALPTFSGGSDSGDASTERKLTNYLQSLLLEVGFDDVSSVSPPEGISITSETEYQAFEVPEGADPDGGDCTPKELEICCDAEKLKQYNIDQLLICMAMGCGRDLCPTARPSAQPSSLPSESQKPSSVPSQQPSSSQQPSGSPSTSPSESPSLEPSVSETPTEFYQPSSLPSTSIAPSAVPTLSPILPLHFDGVVEFSDTDLSALSQEENDLFTELFEDAIESFANSTSDDVFESTATVTSILSKTAISRRKLQNSNGDDGIVINYSLDVSTNCESGCPDNGEGIRQSIEDSLGSSIEESLVETMQGHSTSIDNALRLSTATAFAESNELSTSAGTSLPMSTTTTVTTGTSLPMNGVSPDHSSDYYPDWIGNSGTCLNDGEAPLYMMNNREWLESSLHDCCYRYFNYDMSTCLGDFGEVSATTGRWFPDWKNHESTCSNSTVDLPSYMRANLDSWTHPTLHDCCESRFDWAYYDCMKAGGQITSGFIKWRVSWSELVCMQDCPRDSGPTCGGLVNTWDNDYLFDDSLTCCQEMLPWLSPLACDAQSRGVTLKGSSEYYVNYALKKCVKNCERNLEGQDCGGIATDKWRPMFSSRSECCDEALWWVEKRDCMSV